ncbi:citrate synthase I [Toxoplasma gondii RUB]|uniref:Citrate synthase I n=2 Tax=Toxoplasma gondii TaxID=5811 RepID=A0A086LXT0_TOXGO|nr:citrate synthase I [Toxoplasma gondii RUB]KFH16816.1 citrate synthase I [Toxoplasma gondii MAS]
MLLSRLRDTAAAALVLRTSGSTALSPPSFLYPASLVRPTSGKAPSLLAATHTSPFFSAPVCAAVQSKRLLGRSQSLFRKNTASALRSFSSSARSVCGGLSNAEARAAVEAALDALAEKVQEAAEPKRELLKTLRKEHGTVVISEATLSTVCGGMRGLTAILTETSTLHAEKGILYRGLTINECLAKLPRMHKEEYPAVEGLIWFLMTGSIPTVNEVELLSNALYALSLSSASSSPSAPFIPPHVGKVLDAVPPSTHPMTQLVMAAAALQPTSELAQAYRHKTVSRHDLWKPALADALSLIAKNAVMAARIFRRSFRDGQEIDPVRSLDWVGKTGFASQKKASLSKVCLKLACIDAER